MIEGRLAPAAGITGKAMPSTRWSQRLARYWSTSRPVSVRGGLGMVQEAEADEAHASHLARNNAYGHTGSPETSPKPSRMAGTTVLTPKLAVPI